MNHYLCLCSHEYSDHRVGVGLEACTHWCGCGEYRLDVRSPVRDETAGSWLDALAEAGPAIWEAKNTGGDAA